MLGSPRFIVPFTKPTKAPEPEIVERHAVRAFVASVGGLENARRAMELLEILSGKEQPRRDAA